MLLGSRNKCEPKLELDYHDERASERLEAQIKGKVSVPVQLLDAEKSSGGATNAEERLKMEAPD